MDKLKLIITGGSTGDDDKFIHKIKNKIKNGGLKQSVEFHKDFEEEGRHDFFNKVSILSVPVLEGEAFGLYLLESMASGVPVVQPKLGAFPELVNLAGGGVLYDPNTPEELAKALGQLLHDSSNLLKLSEEGRKGIIKHFNIHNQASNMVEIYQQIIEMKNKESNAA